MDFFQQDIKFLQGVGPKRAELFNKELNIFTVEDLLRHYPYRYVDRSKFYKIRDISGDDAYIQIRGKIVSFETIGEKRKQRLSAQFSDGERTIELIWFQGAKFILEKYRTDVEYVLFGKPSLFNGKYNFSHPELDLPSQLPPPEKMGLQPFYHTTEKMKNNYLNSKAIQKILFPLTQILQKSDRETLPKSILEQYKLLNLSDSLINIHFPQNNDLLARARERLKFEELFYIQLSILSQKKWRETHYEGFVFSKVGNFFNTFYSQYLPFELTNAQKRVIKEIRQDLGSGKQMNRLLQGDVGSGKTLVALMTMLIANDNDFQACLMAPTEILANQHFETISALLENMDVEVGLLTGSTKQKDRKNIFEKLENGTTKILIGTHALIEDTVVFNNLGLVIIDEQHRFGVEQRSRLWSKNNQPPHILVMTATPIPRTLAMTFYGDLSVSVIDELPPGRKPIQTYHYFENKRNALLAFLVKQINAGRQIYVVYPLIQESEKIDLMNLEAGYSYFKEMLPHFKISMVHGKMKSAEKDKEMQKFVSGETQLMVATTVIEVGVNVPNASVMVIESAERFGLSQLHQLRGRVGRGAEQSFCILLTGVKLSKTSRQRMEIMTNSNDGFEIAEADLRLRGPGDMEGTQQSGMPFELKISNLYKDGQILELARTSASDTLEDWINLNSFDKEMMKNELKKLKSNAKNWSAIS